MKALFATLMLGLALTAHAATVDRVEPPNWWIGMKQPRVELMLHGPGIAEARVELAATPGVSLVGSQRAVSPNYLFVQLDVGTQAQAGELSLALTRPGEPTTTLRYPLKARAPGSAERQGFGPKDAIYLVVPDRFARAGQIGAAGLQEGLHREDPSGRHGGDLAGMTRHLDYIAGLGFTQVWPTPLVENDAPRYSYHGYAATDFYRIDPRFGSLDDYLQFSAAARQRGVGVIQDIVLNHIGTHHWWMRDLPAPDWVNQWTAAAPGRSQGAAAPSGGGLDVQSGPGGTTFTETHHARMSLQDPHAAPSDRKRFSDGWFSRNMPDLNQRNPHVAAYLTQMTLWWIEAAGLSGLRTDTYSYSDKDFLAAWSARVMAEYPRLNIVGEEWSPHPAVVSYWQRGKHNPDGFATSAPSMMDFPLHGALLAALNEADSHDSGFTRLYEALAHDFLYPAPEQLVLFDGNHDTPRVFSALHEDAALTRMALAYLATTSRIPQLFYGSELLLTSPRERDDGKVRADMPGGWPGDRVDAFSGAGLSAEQRAMQDWVRKLFNWRKTATVVHEGRLMQYAPMQGCYVFFRYTEGQRLMVVLNKNREATTLDTRRFPEMITRDSRGRDILSGQNYELGRSLNVPARSALIIELSSR